MFISSNILGTNYTGFGFLANLYLNLILIKSLKHRLDWISKLFIKSLSLILFFFISLIYAYWFLRSFNTHVDTNCKRSNCDMNSFQLNRLISKWFWREILRNPLNATKHVYNETEMTKIILEAYYLRFFYFFKFYFFLEFSFSIMTLKLYYDLISQPSRALYIIFKVCNIPFEKKIVNLKNLEQYTPEFEQINPFKKVPVIEHDGYKLGERYYSLHKIILIDTFTWSL